MQTRKIRLKEALCAVHVTGRRARNNIGAIAFSRFVVPRSRTKSVFHASIHNRRACQRIMKTLPRREDLRAHRFNSARLQCRSHVFLLYHLTTNGRSLAIRCMHVPYTVITRGRQPLKRSIIHAACITSHCAALFDPRAR